VRSALALFAISACVGALLGGCSDSQAGVAQPVETTETGESTPSKAPAPTTGSSASSPLDGVDPCELLTDAERAQLRLEPGEPSKAGRDRACDWNSTDWSVGVNFNVDLGFKDADLRGATAIPIDIGRHEAYRVENAGGSRGVCEIFIVTSESSFAQLTGVKGVDTPTACERVIPIAKIIDPKLP
jgi:Protein of unknown function (DUF3558)